MRSITRALAFLLVVSMFLCAAPSGGSRALASVSASTLSTTPAPPDTQQAGDATSEREQGRALLHRGKAAEALIHLERALKAFQQSGSKSGEASTRDLLGELYERQGRYDAALENYTAAHDLYVAAASGGKLPPQAAALTALTTE